MRGLVVAGVLFLGSFVLHIVGGATDQGWLFAIAVGLIFLTAAGFPGVALWGSGLSLAGGSRASKVVAAIGSVAGVGLTLAALWAANDRSFAAWEFGAAPILVGVVSGAVLLVRGRTGVRSRFGRFSIGPNPTRP